jgi:hypothetical protein
MVDHLLCGWGKIAGGGKASQMPPYTTTADRFMVRE